MWSGRYQRQHAVYVQLFGLLTSLFSGSGTGPLEHPEDGQESDCRPQRRQTSHCAVQKKKRASSQQLLSTTSALKEYPQLGLSTMGFYFQCSRLFSVPPLPSPALVKHCSFPVCVCVCVCVLAMSSSLERCRPGAQTHRGVDLAVVGGHAVAMVEVGEGLGRPPRLQVPGHPDRSPHLPPIQ